MGYAVKRVPRSENAGVVWIEWAEGTGVNDPYEAIALVTGTARQWQIEDPKMGITIGAKCPGPVFKNLVAAYVNLRETRKGGEYDAQRT